MIRPAASADHAVIRTVVAAAFGREDEADLVDRLRADGDALHEFVAETDGAVVGHILFSRLRLHAADVLEAAALAPVAVLPGHQSAGHGSALIKAGIAAYRAAGLPAVVVLGHPAYYPRFGFTAAAAARLSAPFSGPSFMALELTEGALHVPRVTQYAEAFGLGAWFRAR